MALLRGRLFAGALFAGALFGASTSTTVPVIPPPIPYSVGGGGGGSGSGAFFSHYKIVRDDYAEDTKQKQQIQQEDDIMLSVIMSAVTRGML